MGVSKNRGGPPTWMVKMMENPIKMDDLGIPLFSETPRWELYGQFIGTSVEVTLKWWQKVREGLLLPWGLRPEKAGKGLTGLTIQVKDFIRKLSGL